jgi:hypothetical protein
VSHPHQIANIVYNRSISVRPAALLMIPVGLAMASIRRIHNKFRPSICHRCKANMETENQILTNMLGRSNENVGMPTAGTYMELEY